MQSAEDVAYASASELLERYRTKALSPVEAAAALFDRLEALEPKLNAFCIVDRASGAETAACPSLVRAVGSAGSREAA
jgi:aspartyl-tRNA(Asn)/glutamyl-tRNA(Gln) amidotransferase subunit A